MKEVTIQLQALCTPTVRHPEYTTLFKKFCSELSQPVSEVFFSSPLEDQSDDWLPDEIEAVVMRSEEKGIDAPKRKRGRPPKQQIVLDENKTVVRLVKNNKDHANNKKSVHMGGIVSAIVDLTTEDEVESSTTTKGGEILRKQHNSHQTKTTSTRISSKDANEPHHVKEGKLKSAISKTTKGNQPLSHKSIIHDVADSFRKTLKSLSKSSHRKTDDGNSITSSSTSTIPKTQESNTRRRTESRTSFVAALVKVRPDVIDPHPSDVKGKKRGDENEQNSHKSTSSSSSSSSSSSISSSSTIHKSSSNSKSKSQDHHHKDEKDHNQNTSQKKNKKSKKGKEEADEEVVSKTTSKKDLKVVLMTVPPSLKKSSTNSAFTPVVRTSKPSPSHPSLVGNKISASKVAIIPGSTSSGIWIRRSERTVTPIPVVAPCFLAPVDSIYKKPYIQRSISIPIVGGNKDLPLTPQRLLAETPESPMMSPPGSAKLAKGSPTPTKKQVAATTPMKSKDAHKESSKEISKKGNNKEVEKKDCTAPANKQPQQQIRKIPSVKAIVAVNDVAETSSSRMNGHVASTSEPNHKESTKKRKTVEAGTNNALRAFSRDGIMKLLSFVYNDVFDGYRIPQAEKRFTNNTTDNLDGFGAATYGEIAVESVGKMIELLKINENDVFYDLGSGVGKAVIQVALQTRCRRSIGIELSSTRYDASEQAKMNLEKCLKTGAYSKFFSASEGVNKRKKTSPFDGVMDCIKFINRDILKCDMSDATCIYWNNLCFSTSASIKVLEKLKTLKKGTRILCSRKLCQRHGQKCWRKKDLCTNLTFLKEDEISCTWTIKCNVFVYEIDPQ